MSETGPGRPSGSFPFVEEGQKAPDDLGILLHASPRTIQEIDRRRGTLSRAQFVLTVLEEVLTRSAAKPPPPRRPKPKAKREDRRYWTVDEETTLRRLHEAGSTVSEIALQLDRSAIAIDGRLRLHGLVPRR
jgi:hypothetical protein